LWFFLVCGGGLAVYFSVRCAYTLDICVRTCVWWWSLCGRLFRLGKGACRMLFKWCHGVFCVVRCPARGALVLRPENTRTRVKAPGMFVFSGEPGRPRCLIIRVSLAPMSSPAFPTTRGDDALATQVVRIILLLALETISAAYAWTSGSSRELHQAFINSTCHATASSLRRRTRRKVQQTSRAWRTPSLPQPLPRTEPQRHEPSTAEPHDFLAQEQK